jgi:peptidyl-prolyl cis-trans isomerase B (cyclophilin B)
VCAQFTRAERTTADIERARSSRALSVNHPNVGLSLATLQGAACAALAKASAAWFARGKENHEEASAVFGPPNSSVEPARGRPQPGASRLGCAGATASRRLLLAPSGYSFSRGSRRAASLARHAGRARLTERPLGRRSAEGCWNRSRRESLQAFLPAFHGRKIAVSVSRHQRRKNRSHRSLPADVTKPDSAETSPQSLQDAVMRNVWRLPRRARNVAVTIMAIGAAVFATWQSLPEKSREQGISRLIRTESVPPDHLEILNKIVADRAAPLTIEQLRQTVVDFRTSKGLIQIEVLPDVAPNHARNFVELARAGLYDGTRFHRTIPGFIVMGGDPNTKSEDRGLWGLGGAIGTLRPEFNDTPQERGTVSMGHATNPNTGSSQFFICLGRQSILDRRYTAFGRVVSGMDVVDRIAAAPRNAQDQPFVAVAIESAAVHLR